MVSPHHLVIARKTKQLRHCERPKGAWQPCHCEEYSDAATLFYIIVRLLRTKVLAMTPSVVIAMINPICHREAVRPWRSYIGVKLFLNCSASLRGYINVRLLQLCLAMTIPGYCKIASLRSQ